MLHAVAHLLARPRKFPNTGWKHKSARITSPPPPPPPYDPNVVIQFLTKPENPDNHAKVLKTFVLGLGCEFEFEL